MDDVGTIDRQLQSDDSPGRMTGDMRPTYSKLAEQRRGIGRVLREGHRRRAIDSVGELPLPVCDQAVAFVERLLGYKR